jgi:hypothetical protein
MELDEMKYDLPNIADGPQDLSNINRSEIEKATGVHVPADYCRLPWISARFFAVNPLYY